MPRTIDHLVHTHQIARQRVAEGKPAWERTIDLSDVFHNDRMTFVQRRDAIVKRFRSSPWVKEADEFGELVEAVDNLAETEDGDEFDGWWDELYDLADIDRVNIRTR